MILAVMMQRQRYLHGYITQLHESLNRTITTRHEYLIDSMRVELLRLRLEEESRQMTIMHSITLSNLPPLTTSLTEQTLSTDIAEDSKQT